MMNTWRNKTHCKEGHELTADNRNSQRRCKICAREAVRRTYIKHHSDFVGPRRPQGWSAPSTTCRNGHDLAAYGKDAKGNCVICRREGSARAYKKRLEKFVGPRRPRALAAPAPSKTSEYRHEYAARYRKKKREEFVGPLRPRGQAKEVCSRGHLRTPDNLDSSGHCRTCRLEFDVKRNRYRQEKITNNVVASMMGLRVADIPPEVIALYRERVLLKRERGKQNGDGAKHS